MFMRFAALLPIAAFIAVAAAAPSELAARASTSQCNTGTIQCCSQTFTQSQFQSTYGGLLQLLGITVTNAQSLVGYQCTGTTACTQQPVCCTGNSFNGLITVGCSPITING